MSFSRQQRKNYDDLFTAVTPHLEKMQNPNDVHFNAAGLWVPWTTGS